MAAAPVIHTPGSDRAATAAADAAVAAASLLVYWPVRRGAARCGGARGRGCAAAAAPIPVLIHLRQGRGSLRALLPAAVAGDPPGSRRRRRRWLGVAWHGGRVGGAAGGSTAGDDG